MSKLIRARYRLLALLILILILGAATYGFAAANTVPDGKAGEGSGVISGYDVTGVTYTLDSGDPTAFSLVEFDLGAAASQVYAGLGDGSTIEWVACTQDTGTTWDCDLSGVGISVYEATELHVSSAE